MEEIFDIFAELCSIILGSFREEDFIHYSCISHPAEISIREKISERLPQLFCEEGSEGFPAGLGVRRLTEEDLSADFVRELTALISDFRDGSELFSLIHLLQVLDEGLEDILHGKIAEYQDDRYSVVLNANREATGVGLLPKCSCVWERKHRLSHSYSRLDNYLFHFLLLENRVLDELVDVHFFLKPDFFPRFEKSGELKIAASPLSLDRGFRMDFYEKNSVDYFGITYNGNQNAAENGLIWEKIITAAANECDIAVFPEVMGNPDTVEDIRGRLAALDPGLRETMPSLIILPSVWNAGTHMNTVTVLDRSGNILCRQNKQVPYRMSKDGRDYLEDIRTSQVISIFHYEGIGRIAILICKDFLLTDYMEKLMRSFKLSLIIVPSFSTGSYDFRQSFDLCAHDDCNVVWINTCAALEEGKEKNFKNIGYVRKRVGRDDDDAQRLQEMPACNGAFSGKCTRDCIFFDTIRGV